MAAPAWANTFGRDSRPGAGALAPPPYGPGGASVTDGYTAHGRTWAGGTTPAAGRCGQVSESQPLAWAALMEPPPPEVRRVPEVIPVDASAGEAGVWFETKQLAGAPERQDFRCPSHTPVKLLKKSPWSKSNVPRSNDNGATENLALWANREGGRDGCME
ncbi:hypothetical protein GN956_G16995 [Arapaima gigas]